MGYRLVIPFSGKKALTFLLPARKEMFVGGIWLFNSTGGTSIFKHSFSSIYSLWALVPLCSPAESFNLYSGFFPQYLLYLIKYKCILSKRPEYSNKQLIM